MTEARQRVQWAHTSSLMALIANAHRDPKKSRRFTPDDFNPTVVKKTTHDKQGFFTALKAMFIREKEASQPTDASD